MDVELDEKGGGEGRTRKGGEREERGGEGRRNESGNYPLLPTIRLTLYDEERPVTIEASEARKPVKNAEFFMNSQLVLAEA